MRKVTVAIGFVNGLLHHTSLETARRDEVLAQVGIAPTLLLQPKARVSARQFAALAGLLIKLTDDECLGYGERPLRPGAFAMMSELAVHCATLQQAMQKCAEFINILDSGIRLELVIHPSYAAFQYLEVKPGISYEPFFFEVSVMVFHQLFSWLIGQQIALECVRFRHQQPTYLHEYTAMYNCLVGFDSERNEFMLSTDYLQKPVVQSELNLRDMLRNSPLFILQRHFGDSSYVGKIRNLLSRHYVDFPDFELIAEQLRVTPRTLRRNLKKEGHSYQQIKNDLRRDAAIHFLTRRGLTIAAVAQRVGFSDTSTFIRAFKSWTGVTPQVYKKSQAALR